MSVQPKHQLSVEEWLAGEREAFERRCELVDGEIFDMTGAKFAHNVIVANIGAGLHAQIRGRPCHVLMNDMKVLVRSEAAGLYPDIVGLCDEPELHDGRQDVLLNPSLIVEVLSDSTEGYDRGRKFALYRQLPSLRDYLLVSQHEVSVDCYVRAKNGEWTLRAYDGLEDRVQLSSVGCTLVLSEVYDKVSFDVISGE